MRPFACLLGLTLVGGLAAAAHAATPAQPLAPAALDGAASNDGPFRRIATFPVFRNTSVGTETVAEIVAYCEATKELVYTDSANGSIGFIDIKDASDPQPGGVLAMGGEPTSVTTLGKYALVCVDTSANFVNTSGVLQVVDVKKREIVRTLPLGGQPDAIAVSPSGKYAAIAIENERDEDLGSGAPPQLPAGYVVIVDLVGTPTTWTTRTVDLVGVPDLFPQDPEPEFVDINEFDVAAVTLQENNHIVLIHLPSGQILKDFPAGTVDLNGVDVEENDLIQQVDALPAVAREPDAVVWTSPFTFATANEGDLFGGSRGFSTWLATGGVLFDSGNRTDRLAARVGHYPEGRSENKGVEPEGADFARFGSKNFLFVGCERSNLVEVRQLVGFPILGAKFPILRQVLPTGVAPEGLLAIPSRDLFVVSCEEDSRGDKIRSSVMIYRYGKPSNYPTVVSVDRAPNEPIPWAALSGLAPHPESKKAVFAVHDSFYRSNRIYTLDVSDQPAVIQSELVIRDVDAVLLDALDELKQQLPATPQFVPSSFVNADDSVNLDPEGIAALEDGTFWIASEGAGNLVAGVPTSATPFASPNLLLRVDADGVIVDAVLPPLSVTRGQLRFGYEGVAAVGQYVYVCFQRQWTALGDPLNRVRIGRFDTLSRTWAYAYYPIETPTSPNGGWVGLSELSYAGDGTFVVIERDDQGGPDASIKRLYSFSVDGVAFVPDANTPLLPTVSKTLVLDLLAADVYGPFAGLTPEKQEGLAVLKNGDVLLVNDNDGVDDNNGETLLVRLKKLLQ
jgi:hypothetical protein